MHHLSASQTALLVAVPVLLGALARLPMGLLTDRYKGRAVFTGLLVFAAVPICSRPAPALTRCCWWWRSSWASPDRRSPSEWDLSRAGFPPEQQGSALGVYGLGNIGQSAAVFLDPCWPRPSGWRTYSAASRCCCSPGRWCLSSRPATLRVTVRPKPFSAMLALLARERLAWVLSAFYFLTFGGFVAFSIYLPSAAEG